MSSFFVVVVVFLPRLLLSFSFEIFEIVQQNTGLTKKKD